MTADYSDNRTQKQRTLDRLAVQSSATTPAAQKIAAKLRDRSMNANSDDRQVHQLKFETNGAYLRVPNGGMGKIHLAGRPAIFESRGLSSSEVWELRLLGSSSP